MQVEMTEAMSASRVDERKSSVAPRRKLRLAQYGPRAVLDMTLIHALVVRHAGQIVPRTFLPMMRIATPFPEEVDRAYAQLLRSNETLRWSDSPRERWRKMYGNFVREMEWALGELQYFFSREEYEQIVVDTVTSITRRRNPTALACLKVVSRWHGDALAAHFQGLDSASARGVAGKGGHPSGRSVSGRLGGALFQAAMRVLNGLVDPTLMAGFLVGDAHVGRFDATERKLEIEAPSCAWHRCASPAGEGLDARRTRESCSLVCKAVTETLFDGTEGPTLRFEPRLSRGSCTLHLRW